MRLPPSFTGFSTTRFRSAATRSRSRSPTSWGDHSAHYLVDTTIPHTYRLRVTPAGDGEVYVDNVLALSRPGIAIGPMVGFGDQTNDWGVDGQFEISDVELVANAWCKTGPPPPK